MSLSVRESWFCVRTWPNSLAPRSAALAKQRDHAEIVQRQPQFLQCSVRHSAGVRGHRLQRVCQRRRLHFSQHGQQRSVFGEITRLSLSQLATNDPSQHQSSVPNRALGQVVNVLVNPYHRDTSANLSQDTVHHVPCIGV